MRSGQEGGGEFWGSSKRLLSSRLHALLGLSSVVSRPVCSGIQHRSQLWQSNSFSHHGLVIFVFGVHIDADQAEVGSYGNVLLYGLAKLSAVCPAYTHSERPP